MCAVAAVFALKGKIVVPLVPGNSYSGRTRASERYECIPMVPVLPCCACMHAHVHVIIRHQRRISAEIRGGSGGYQKRRISVWRGGFWLKPVVRIRQIRQRISADIRQRIWSVTSMDANQDFCSNVCGAQSLSKTFIQTFGVQSNTFVPTFWVQSKTFVQTFCV